ncbi:MAG: RNA polymerase factor sigma-54, partial [Eggerthellaceae bacterium]|nr:RNA polymerase factor sigma-54 [Eggerthellaceae bacterium]
CLGQGMAQVAHVLALLQACQPAGVAARSLSECLLLQLDAIGEGTGLASVIVETQLECLAKVKLKRIAADCGVAVEEVQEAVDLIRGLNPRPGSPFSGPGNEAVVPEVALKADGGSLSVEMLDVDIPHLGIAPEYSGLLQKGSANQETRQYLRDSLKAAKALVESVEQRRVTLFRIACCIMCSQEAFLLEGFAGVRPLTMREVADQAGVSESTVSRMVNGNYIQTPHGVYELRAFFSGGASQGSQCDASSASVKKLMRKMVDEEDKRRPLSDTQIVERLLLQGVEVSRRTVNKYRNVLGIPNSPLRQRY